MEEREITCEECHEPVLKGQKVLKIIEEIHPDEQERTILVHARCYPQYIRKECENYHDKMIREVLML